MKKKELKKALRKATVNIEVLEDTIHYDKLTIKALKDTTKHIPTIEELSTNAIFDILANRHIDDDTGYLLDELDRRMEVLVADSKAKML